MGDFKTQIKKLREASKLTHSQVASIFDKSEGAIRAWEAGRTKPDADTLIKIAQYFNVTTDYLLGLSDAKNPEAADVMKVTGLTEKSVETLKAIKNNPENEVINYLLENEEFKWFLELFARHKKRLEKSYGTDEPFKPVEKNDSPYDNPYLEIQDEAGANLFAMQKLFFKLSDDYREKCIHEIVEKINENPWRGKTN